MNKIYKVVWNRVRQCYVVTHEFARRRARAQQKASISLLAAGSVFIFSGMASAADLDPITATTMDTTSPSATASGTDSLAVGANANAGADNAIVVGANATAGAAGGIAFGTGAKSVAANATVVGTNASVGAVNGIAIGTGAQSNAADTTVVGTNATAGTAVGGIAIGSGSSVAGNHTIAIGTSARGGTGLSNIAIGSYAQASGGQSIAIGSGSSSGAAQITRATGPQSIAIGSNTFSKGDSSIAIGGDDVDSASDKTVKDSEGNTITLETYYNRLTGKSLEKGKYTQTQTGHIGIALGAKSVAGDMAFAAGAATGASALASVAVGTGAKADKVNSVAIGAGSTTEVAGTPQATVVYNGVTYTWAGGTNTGEGDIVSFGSAGYERQLKSVAAGEVSATSTDAINGSQLYEIIRTSVWQIGDNSLTAVGSGVHSGVQVNFTDSSALTAKVSAAPNNALGITPSYDVTYDLSDATKTDIQKGVDAHTVVTTKGLTFQGNTGSTNTELLGSTVAIQGSNSNIQTAASGDQILISLSDDLKVNSLKAGGTMLNAGGLNVGGSTVVNAGGVSVGGNTYITSQGINANHRSVINVKAGEVSATSTEAVNGSQLYQTNQNVNRIEQSVTNIDQSINTMHQSIHVMDNRISKVGAGAAAMAALHPGDFDPDDKWNFAAGYGNYRDANAMAVGAFYRPNEDTIFSIGGSMGNGENMINVGVSLKFGQKNNVSSSRVAMAKEIEHLHQRLQEMDEKYNKLLALLNAEKQVEAQETTLRHIRVDRISGEDSDRHKVERVRVNNENDPDNNAYRDIYGSRIQPAEK